tara:strand:+ start:1446 stop:4619 length:3174 start_codon:yes stop_codon:yes gene_type:complete
MSGIDYDSDDEVNVLSSIALINISTLDYSNGGYMRYDADISNFTFLSSYPENNNRPKITHSFFKVGPLAYPFNLTLPPNYFFIPDFDGGIPPDDVTQRIIIGANVDLSGVTMRLPSAYDLSWNKFHGNGDISGSGLEYLYLDYADISGTKFGLGTGVSERLNMQYSVFNHANLTNTVFENVDLSGARFIDASLNAGLFIDASMNGVDLSGALLTNTVFENVDLSGASFLGSDINLDGARFRNVIPMDGSGIKIDKDKYRFINGSLVGPNLDMSGVDLSGGDISGIDLSGSNLYMIKGRLSKPSSRLDLLPPGYIIHNGYIVGPSVDLSGADLTDIDISGSSGSNLFDLSHSILTNCNLSSGRFENVDIRGCDLKGATFQNFYSKDLSSNDNTLLGHKRLIRKGILLGPGVDLSGHDLTGIRIDDATGGPNCVLDLIGANFYRAKTHNIIKRVNDKICLSPGVNIKLNGKNTDYGDYVDGVKSYIIFARNIDLSGVVFGDVGPAFKDHTEKHFTNIDISGAILTHLRTSDLKDHNGNLIYTDVDTIKDGNKLPQGYAIARGSIIGPTVKLSGFDIGHGNFAGVNLSGADLSGTTLTGAKSGRIENGNKLYRGNVSPSNAPLNSSGHGVDLTNTDFQIYNGFFVGPDVDISGQRNDSSVPINLGGNETLLQNLSDVSGGRLADLSGIDLSGMNLSGCSFSNVLFYGAKSGSSSAGLNGNIDGVGGLIVDNDIYKVVFHNKFLVGRGVNIVPQSGIPDLSNVDLSGVDLFAADLSGANLTGAKSGLANEGTGEYRRIGGILPRDGSGVKLAGDYRLHNGWLVGQGMVLSSADISNIDLRGIHLTGTDLSGAYLYGAKSSINNPIIPSKSVGQTGAPAFPSSGVRVLSSSDDNNLRSEVVIYDGCLITEGVDLSGVDLKFADLSGISLKGVSSRNIKPEYDFGQQIIGFGSGGGTYIVVKGYILGPGVNLGGVDLGGASLAGIDLGGLDLSGIDFSELNLSNVNLSNSVLDNSNFQNAQFENINITNAIIDIEGLTGPGSSNNIDDSNFRNLYSENECCIS